MPAGMDDRVRDELAGQELEVVDDDRRDAVLGEERDDGVARRRRPDRARWARRARAGARVVTRGGDPRCIPAAARHGEVSAPCAHEPNGRPGSTAGRRVVQGDDARHGPGGRRLMRRSTERIDGCAAAPPGHRPARSPCPSASASTAGATWRRPSRTTRSSASSPCCWPWSPILGIVLEDRAELRDDLVDGALGQIPVHRLASWPTPSSRSTGSGWVVVLGLATAIWAGMGAVGALQLALDELWDTPVHRRPSFVMKRVRALAFLVLFGLGLAAVDAAVQPGHVLRPRVDRRRRRAARCTLVVDTALLLMMFTVLPGAAAAAPRAAARRGRRRGRAASLLQQLGQLRRPPLHRRRQRHLRHVRRRHRPAQLVPPGQPAGAAVGRAQRGARRTDLSPRRLLAGGDRHRRRPAGPDARRPAHPARSPGRLRREHR